MRTRFAVAVISLLLLLYLWLVMERAIQLLLSGEVLGVLMGAALLLLPVIALYLLAREIIFGVQAEAAGAELARLGQLPEDKVRLRPSGAPVRADADELYPRYRQDVVDNPVSWQAWYRLGLVYDAAGDRRQARAAIRRAISLRTKSRLGS